MSVNLNESLPERLPEWVRQPLDLSGTRPTRTILKANGVVTVCEEARCPNRAECFQKPTAAFMVLGRNCTRNCGFCSVAPVGPAGPDSPLSLDMDEPERVARAALRMGLSYVVITSVTRDDLPDGGASQFARTVRAIKRLNPKVRVEVLTPDFSGDLASLDTVLEASPDVYNHNLETVPSLYLKVRPGADYTRSLMLLKHAGEHRARVLTKSGLMLGVGESLDEVRAVLHDLRTVGCDFVTIGQYLRPGRDNLPVKEYIRPEVFMELGEYASRLGFLQVSSSPLTRSSMNAEEMFSLRQGR